jgi:ribosome biogenesis GTPase / thiamine phosphate phosphatase
VSDIVAEIEALSGGCQSSGCRHDDEPGCAVAAAVASGALDPARLASFRELRGGGRGLEPEAGGKVAGGRRRLEQQRSRALRAELKRRRRCAGAGDPARRRSAGRFVTAEAAETAGGR